MLVLNFLGRIILPELVESKDITLNLDIILNFIITDKVQKCKCQWIGFPLGENPFNTNEDWNYYLDI